MVLTLSMLVRLVMIELVITNSTKGVFVKGVDRLGITKPEEPRLGRRGRVKKERGSAVTQHAYQAIAAALREEIADGIWPAGTALPTIPVLMDRFGVSRITVRGAIDQLAAENLVYTGYIEGRRGTIVRGSGRVPIYVTDSIRPDRPQQESDVFVEVAERAGASPTKRFDMRIAAPPNYVATRLGTEPDELVVTRTTYQLLDSEPWSSETTYFPREFAELTGVDSPRDIPEGTTRRIAECGYPETAWLDEVLDETAGPDDAEHLMVPVGYALLVRLRTGATAERITRVTRIVQMGHRTRLVWELGDNDGARKIIRDACDRAGEL